MPIKSSAHRYGSVVIMFHWLSAAAILALLVLGVRAAGTEDPSAKAALLRVHVPLGGLILAVTVLRLAWRMADRRPHDLAGTPRWQAMTARVVHALLYGTILVLGASGVVLVAVSGAGSVLFAAAPAALPNFRDYAPRTWHGLGAFVLLSLIAIHAGAVLYHLVIRRDRPLARIGIGRS